MTRKSATLLLVVAAFLLLPAGALADKPTQTNGQGEEVAWEATQNGCTTIQDGTLVRGDGVTIQTGYDEWGYNYQAHMFNGTYCDAYRNDTWCQPWVNDELIMKWNDAWLSNVDCDGDHQLDRHYGFASYIGSGAWETNHQAGTYELDGQTCHWTYFVKIVAAPLNATKTAGVWYAADATEIGPDIWGEFAIVEEVFNDPCGGAHGISYLSPDHPGFGGW